MQHPGDEEALDVGFPSDASEHARSDPDREAVPPKVFELDQVGRYVAEVAGDGGRQSDIAHVRGADQRHCLMHGADGGTEGEVGAVREFQWVERRVLGHD